MIVVRVEIISYDMGTNTCKAGLLNGDIVNLDPYVGRAIELTNEDYESGKGADIVGNSYLLTEYSVHSDIVLPAEGGMTIIN